MKHYFDDNSITHKITAVFMLTAGASLLLAYMLMQSLSLATRIGDKLSDVSEMADVVATNRASSLVFDDTPAAFQLLQALKGWHEVVQAKLFNSKGELFASYAPVHLEREPPRRWDSQADSGIFNFLLAQSAQIVRPVTNGTYLSPDSVTTTVCSLDGAQRNPGNRFHD